MFLQRALVFFGVYAAAMIAATTPARASADVAIQKSDARAAAYIIREQTAKQLPWAHPCSLSGYNGCVPVFDSNGKHDILMLGLTQHILVPCLRQPPRKPSGTCWSRVRYFITDAGADGNIDRFRMEWPPDAPVSAAGGYTVSTRRATLKAGYALVIRMFLDESNIEAH